MFFKFYSIIKPVNQSPTVNKNDLGDHLPSFRHRVSSPSKRLTNVYKTAQPAEITNFQKQSQKDSTLSYNSRKWNITCSSSGMALKTWNETAERGNECALSTLMAWLFKGGPLVSVPFACGCISKLHRASRPINPLSRSQPPRPSSALSRRRRNALVGQLLLL